MITIVSFTGIYGHSAVYDKPTNNILVFGGVIFSNEKVHESMDLYAFDLSKLTWNLLQHNTAAMVSNLLEFDSFHLYTSGLLTKPRKWGDLTSMPKNYPGAR